MNGKATSEYETWQNMRGRCRDPNDPSFKYYGARGISVCERWRKFENFLQDMGDRPPGLTLDRIDNDGDYTPENCRWGTASEQARNRRDRPKVLYAGKQITLIEAVELSGLPYGTVMKRRRMGWPEDRWFIPKLR